MTIEHPTGEVEQIRYAPRYPFYLEPKVIQFLPTYKRNHNDNWYKNKKSQAPSYCDRILFKNNTIYPCNVNYYKCLDHVFGSDHRPVLLSLNLSQRLPQNSEPYENLPLFVKNIANHVYKKEDKEMAMNVYKLLNFKVIDKYVSLNLSQVRQKFGVLSFKFIRIQENLILPKDVQGGLTAQIKK